MWPVLILAIVASAGVLFLLRFLVALLREKPPSICYWVTPHQAALASESDESFPGYSLRQPRLHKLHADESDRSAAARLQVIDYPAVLEKANYAEQASSSNHAVFFDRRTAFVRPLRSRANN